MLFSTNAVCCNKTTAHKIQRRRDLPSPTSPAHDERDLRKSHLGQLLDGNLHNRPIYLSERTFPLNAAAPSTQHHILVGDVSVA